MKTRFVEATQGIEGGFNHGKFMVAFFEQDEWDRPSAMDLKFAQKISLLYRTGWSKNHVLVFDLQTGEGAIFLPGGAPRADLSKHRIWVCPMFEPFLEWLYDFSKGLDWFDRLPPIVEIPDAPASMQGYRRAGK